MRDSFIIPVFLYGIEYVLAVMALCAFAALLCVMRRRFVMALVCAVLLVMVVGAVPLYRDTVLRAQDAEAQVVRLLWGRAYPGTFMLSAEGEPGLPPFLRATAMRLYEVLPGTPDWMKFSDTCLRRLEGPAGEKRRFDIAELTIGAAREKPECHALAEIRAAFGVDIVKILAREYAALRVYAAKVDAADRTAQDHCPPFYSDRGRHQKQELNKRTGLMQPPYDLSGIKCACVALGRHKGCRVLDERDRTEGYVAALRQFDFFTPLTCDQSELCSVLRGFLKLENEAPDVSAEEAAALIARATERCVATEQFSPQRRAALCDCSMRMLVGQDPQLARLGMPAARCLVEEGFLDDEKCVIGEADWNIQREAVTMCIMAGGGGAP